MSDRFQPSHKVIHLGYFIYASMIRTSNDEAVLDDNPRIGYYSLNGDGTVDSHYWIYSSRSNLDPIATRHYQPVYPGSPPGVTPSMIELPRYSQEVRTTGVWQKVGDTLTARFGPNVHQWALQPQGHYLLTQKWAGVRCIGYGYLTDDIDVTQQLFRPDFHDYYGFGQQTYTRNLPGEDRCAPKTWTAGNQTLNLDAFQVMPKNQHIWGYFQPPGAYPYGVLNTMLLNHAAFSNLIVYNNNGYDYNGNTVFDEHQHTYIYWCIWDRATRMVKAIVYAQCFHQGPIGTQTCPTNPSAPNYAIVGVGHYLHLT
jgi:hypothetical protein